MHVYIERFKSIEQLELELRPLTIIVSPPGFIAADLLEAVALLGYLPRLYRLEEEYGNSIEAVEPLDAMIPAETLEAAAETNAKLKLIRDKTRVSLSVLRDSAGTIMRLEVDGRGVAIPPSPCGEAVEALRSLQGVVPEARLYSFTRYGLGLAICRDEYCCGFGYRLACRFERGHPRTILSEFAWNVCTVTRSLMAGEYGVTLSTLLDFFDEAFRDVTGGIYDVKVGSGGRMLAFVRHVSVEPWLLPAHNLRVLYYMLAMASGIHYLLRYNLRPGDLILLLDLTDVTRDKATLLALAGLMVLACKAGVYIVAVTSEPSLVTELSTAFYNVKTAKCSTSIYSIMRGSGEEKVKVRTHSLKSDYIYKLEEILMGRNVD